MLAATLATAALAFTAAGHSTIPLRYYQGATVDPAGKLYFDGIFTGLYRTDAALRQQAGVDGLHGASVTFATGSASVVVCLAAGMCCTPMRLRNTQYVHPW